MGLYQHTSNRRMFTIIIDSWYCKIYIVNCEGIVRMVISFAIKNYWHININGIRCRMQFLYTTYLTMLSQHCRSQVSSKRWSLFLPLKCKRYNQTCVPISENTYNYRRYMWKWWWTCWWNDFSVLAKLTSFSMECNLCRKRHHTCSFHQSHLLRKCSIIENNQFFLTLPVEPFGLCVTRQINSLNASVRL